MTPNSAGSDTSKKTCHISVLTNRTIMKISSTGTARVGSFSYAASCPTSRIAVQRRIDSSPIPTTR
jgi:hypothetical protein